MEGRIKGIKGGRRESVRNRFHKQNKCRGMCIGPLTFTLQPLYPSFTRYLTLHFFFFLIYNYNLLLLLINPLLINIDSFHCLFELEVGDTLSLRKGKQEKRFPPTLLPRRVAFPSMFPLGAFSGA